MVRLINKNNVGVISNVAFSILKMQEKLTYIREFNNPNISPCIYVMWHENQFCVHGLPDRGNVNILISNSLDGEIVAQVCEKWGFQICRGSANRKGSVSSTLKMLSKLKKGENVAIMVDGPAGPFHEVKNGVIKVAKKTGAAIIPMTWYSPNKSMLNLPTWDKFQIPMGFTKIVNLYGEPIYISEDADVEEDIRVKQQLKEALLDLDRKAPEAFKEAYKKQK